MRTGTETDTVPPQRPPPLGHIQTGVLHVVRDRPAVRREGRGPHWSPNTWCSYVAGWKHFTNWSIEHRCVGSNRAPHFPFPGQGPRGHLYNRSTARHLLPTNPVHHKRRRLPSQPPYHLKQPTRYPQSFPLDEQRQLTYTEPAPTIRTGRQTNAQNTHIQRRHKRLHPRAGQ